LCILRRIAPSPSGHHDWAWPKNAETIRAMIAYWQADKVRTGELVKVANIKFE
jgi:hypothetical protein